MAKTIPNEEKVFMVSKSTNTTYSGSASLKAMQEWYTMEDVTNTVKPYKVFTALLTQSGGSDPLSTSSGGNPIILGQTYQIIDNGGSGWDFTNIGAPNNNIGTYFIATGITPNSWGIDGQLDYNTGAPVATVLENTIGNIWFTYNGIGFYEVYSSELFTPNKTTLSINLMGDDIETGYLCLGSIINSELLGIVTGTKIDAEQDSVLNWQTPIEIRVYN